MKILVSNDDGYTSEGIIALFKELVAQGHDVRMLAPERERSTVSHSMTLHKPLRIVEREKNCFSLSGSPADCIHVALRREWGFTPDVVLSGINRGANLGTDIHYSGTVACAREAVFHGIPAMAISLVLEHRSTDEEKKESRRKHHYDAAAKVAASLVPWVAKMKKHPRRVLNLNCPNLPFEKMRGLRLGTLGDRNYEGPIIERLDPRGKPYLWIGSLYKGYTPGAKTDNDMIAEGFCSLTPINLDPCDYELMKEIADWSPVFPDR